MLLMMLRAIDDAPPYVTDAATPPLFAMMFFDFAIFRCAMMPCCFR